ncbi:aminoimidazole riboside kinase [[Haemophilus] felis]|uniref:Aminoimidazole riboside kinase n=1 Tax=[Haemophilus] felis TaxID=123822 RepID=A0A1T0BCQ1_9PAST|nr:aminoimidazole riboside kinase [[Haemophilus] felis]NBI40921.1 aminoimidazole riboside kinase [[Haemophilus] felis]OOS07551.1 aminoimidazole riboside kinase [[Haemophilus] felis]
MDKIWVLGDAVVDLLPDGEQHYLSCPGGAPANVAVGIARLGQNVGFIGRVGEDPFGYFLQQTLQKENVCTNHMIFDKSHRTSTVLVSLDKGERSFTFMVNPSADQFLQQSDLPKFNPKEGLHCCSIALLNEPSRATTFCAIEEIKKVGGFFSFDPNLRLSLWQDLGLMKSLVNKAIAFADVVKFSEEEIILLTESQNLSDAIDKITSLYPHKLMIITLGKEGALCLLNGEQKKVVGKAIQPIDTTGAGDAFVSGLLAGLSQLSQWENLDKLVPIVQQANACGALATTQKGAMSALPNKAQLQRFLAATQL